MKKLDYLRAFQKVEMDAAKVNLKKMYRILLKILVKK